MRRVDVPSQASSPHPWAQPNSPALRSVIAAMLQASAAQWPASVHDGTAAAGFLLGADSCYISGTALLVDGAVTAAITTGHLNLSAVLS